LGFEAMNADLEAMNADLEDMYMVFMAKKADKIGQNKMSTNCELNFLVEKIIYL
jgi:hypothetical protein